MTTNFKVGDRVIFEGVIVGHDRSDDDLPFQVRPLNAPGGESHCVWVHPDAIRSSADVHERDAMLTPETKIPWLEGEPTVARLIEQHHADCARIAELEAELRECHLELSESDEDRSEPFAWWLAGGTDIFLATEFTPDTEHRGEWCPLYR